MFTSVSLLLVWAAAFTQAYSNSTSKSPVPITLYYETLCPYSERFILNKLVPTFYDKEFNFAGLLANLTLVPYGHVYNPNYEKYEYTCQHGVPECEGNKLHGCAIKYIEDKRVLLQFFSCLINITQSASGPFSSYPFNECKHLVSDDKMQNISKCYNSNEGWDLFNQHGIATKKFFGPNRYFVPYLSFNNIRNDDLALTVKRNFKKGLCVQNGVEHIACNDNKV